METYLHNIDREKNKEITKARERMEFLKTKMIADQMEGEAINMMEDIQKDIYKKPIINLSEAHDALPQDTTPQTKEPERNTAKKQ